MKGISKRLVLLAATGLFSAALLTGCGSDGKNGADGAPGKDGKDVAVKAAESCSVCHGDGKSAGVDTAHGLANYGDLAVTVGTPTVSGADLVITANIKRNGVNVTNVANFYKRNATAANFAYRLDGPTKTRIALTATIAGGTNGNYTITVVGGAANAAVNSRYLFRLSDLAISNSPNLPGPMVLVDFPAAPVTDVLGASSKSCEDCHGTYGNGFHYGSPAYGGKTCVVCHDANGQNYPLLPGLIHGIHQSGNMPTGKYTAYTRDKAKSWDFEIKFPTYMMNCSTCHQPGAPLNAALAQPVTYDFCMTCHQSWDGFPHIKDNAAFHLSMTAASNCATCHDGATAGATMGAMHNNAYKKTGLYTERGGLVWDGQDRSVSEGAKTAININSVSKSGNNLVIKWGASFNGVATDPCFTGPATSAKPAFAGFRTVVDHGATNTLMHNFSFLKSFFQGDDVVNGANGATSPGQPNSVNVVFPNQPASTAGGAVPTPNTVCTATEATTTIALTAAEQKLITDGASKMRIGLQGKPVLKHDASNTWFYLRALSPVYDLDLKTNAKAATFRRGSANMANSVTETAKCLKCHVGSLYQHGGNRVDNVELCIMCHNEASSEQNVRVTRGITDASKTYDGKLGQTYGFKTMLHRIHASGNANLAGNKPLAIYRNNGIYAFALNEAVMINGWPGTGSKVVNGSNPAWTNTHNFVTAHYPRPLNDCGACHASNFNKVPDATKAMATTIDAGKAPWDNQLDDTLQGPAAAACTSCHASAAAASHAAQFGFTPAVLEKGRQTVIDAAK